MKTFIPGVIVHEFITKYGEKAIIRFPQSSDVAAMTTYINTISLEDTYISLSGEQLSLQEEQTYLIDQFHKMEDGNAVLLLCIINGDLVGVCGINRNQTSRRRSQHIGIFGISLKEYRNQGIGYELAKATVDQAKMNIDNLRIITLTVYKPNERAYHLYKKLGFIEYGVLPEGTRYKDGYIDEIQMYLKVT